MEKRFLPKLYKETGSRATGKRLMEWSLSVNEDEGSWTAHSGTFGGAITDKKTSSKPKNIGKANETTAAQQAVIEATARWKKQVERKLYKEDLNDGKPPLYYEPMLALDATKCMHRLKWDVKTYLTQPKLNGVRVIAYPDGEAFKLQSREGVFYDVPHISEALMYGFSDFQHKLDGELYLGEGYELSDVILALKPNNENHLKLQYHVFDCIDMKAKFLRRLKCLTDAFKSIPNDEPLNIVGCYRCHTEAEMRSQHGHFVSQGYEGIMIRDAYGLYDPGAKNVFMFKYKEFQDQEFHIFGVEPDKDEKGGLLVLKTDNGLYEGEVTVDAFVSRPMGSDEYRADILANPENYIGKEATIRFSGRLKTGVPEFNRAIAIRDYE